MKTFMGMVLALILLTACAGPEAPAFTDNGHPGQIKAVVFADDNRNGAMDSGEAGVQARVGISQDVSCPASSMAKVTAIQSDASGAALFTGLKAGKYCVAFLDNLSMTTPLTVEVYVSSDQTATVLFGKAKE